MKNFAVIGDPIDHSISPEMHHLVYDQTGINAQYSAERVQVTDLEPFIHDCRKGLYDGLNVTLPLKQAIIPFLDTLSTAAEEMGAVNCVTVNNEILTGHNTDWLGFRWLLEQNNINLENRDWIILGAGGSARSILYFLLMGSAKNIQIYNRSDKRARELVNSFNDIHTETNISIKNLSQIPRKFSPDSIIVNCTSVGLLSNHTPLPRNVELNEAILIDLIYHPVETQFLSIGKSQGTRSINGLDMLIGQGLSSLDIWFEEPVSKKIDQKLLRSQLMKILSDKPTFHS